VVYNLCFIPNSISVFKSRRKKWARHVARIRDMINAYKILVGKEKGREILRHGEDGRILLISIV
jgi:hypothetical protein